MARAAIQAARFTGTQQSKSTNRLKKDRQEEYAYSLLWVGRLVKDISGAGIAAALKCP